MSNGSNNFMRYSAIGFQIAGSLVLGFFIGYKLDEWLGNTQPYLTALLAIVFLFAGMYVAFREVLRKGD